MDLPPVPLWLVKSPQGEVLIVELVSVDGFTTGPVVVGEIASLAHEARDDPVEAAALKSETLLPGAESPKVLGGLGDHVGAECHLDAPKGIAARGHIEENNRVCRHYLT